jgi:hypothetical protein
MKTYTGASLDLRSTGTWRSLADMLFSRLLDSPEDGAGEQQPNFSQQE